MKDDEYTKSIERLIDSYDKNIEEWIARITNNLDTKGFQAENETESNTNLRHIFIKDCLLEAGHEIEKSLNRKWGAEVALSCAKDTTLRRTKSRRQEESKHEDKQQA